MSALHDIPVRVLRQPALPTGVPGDDGGEASLYEAGGKVYPRSVTGRFARWRVALVVLTQLVFYGLPWLSWNGRPAMLFDLEARRFYVFGLTFWPQDVVYLTVLLVLCALALFLFTAVAGRMWCGYACPQTVYTEIFLWVERRIEGDRLARLRLDAAPLSLKKIAVKGAKHAAWLAIALWTGYTFVGYFTPIGDLGVRLLSFRLGGAEAFWIAFYGFATWGNAGFMREQVCKYMCPYARFQSVMFDRDTLVVAYDAARGEPRGSRSRKADARSQGKGDCVDCRICVQVCPTGIDIRNGLQHECIGCAACIDACDQVMDRMGYARGLIRYASENALAQRLDRRAMWRRVVRPRSLAYLTLLVVIAAGAGTALMLRNPLRVDVMRDRGALARELPDGAIENVYRVQIMNADEKPRRVHVAAAGLPGLHAAGVPSAIELAGNGVRLLPLRLQAPAGTARAGSHAIELVVIAEDGATRRERSTFIVPQ
jgi:cytochrome c oxidase accessory protein FixG